MLLSPVLFHLVIGAAAAQRAWSRTNKRVKFEEHDGNRTEKQVIFKTAASSVYHFPSSNHKEVIMFVRLTFCKFSPEAIAEVKEIYRQDIAPVVKQQKGNLGILLLEPVDKADDFVSVSRWSSKADADAYDNTGLYKSLIGRLSGFFTKEPVLRSYEAEDGLVTAG